MTKIKTSELTGPALDWAVAKCEGGTDFGFDGITHAFKLNGQLKVLATGWAPSLSYHPSSNWAQGGPIIEREKIQLGYIKSFDEWAAYQRIVQRQTGPTPLIAAMRCYVASKLGDEIDVPKELI